MSHYPMLLSPVINTRATLAFLNASSSAVHAVLCCYVQTRGFAVAVYPARAETMQRLRFLAAVWVGSDPQNKCFMGQCIACSEKNATVTLNDARTLTSVRSHQLFSFSKTSTSLLFFFIVVGRRNDLLNCHQTLRCWFDAALIIASPPSSALEHTIYQRHVRTAVNLLYIA